MSHFTRNEFSFPEKFTHLYTGIAKDDLDRRVDHIFSTSGYRLAEGSPGKGVYVKGNRTMRILLGAFTKYFKFEIATEPVSANELRLSVKKMSSGMSGGLIGMNQVKNEVRRLFQEMQSI